MSKVAVVYWSGTGNTQAMADMVADGIREAGGDAEIFTATEFVPDNVAEFDAFAFGCPAMGDEELEDMEFEPMYSAVEPLLGNKKTMLFGSFSWNDGEWMEIWEGNAKGAGINLVGTVIARDYPDSDAEEECKRIASALV